MNDTERIVAIEILNKLADREIGIRKGHKAILKALIPDIEKQIPKKLVGTSTNMWHCPVCNANVCKGEIYCTQCGQKMEE